MKHTSSVKGMNKMDNPKTDTGENMDKNTLVSQECIQSENEIEKISDESVITHYAVINFFVIAVIVLITMVSFIILTDDEKPDDTENPLTLQTFVSGKFTENLEKSYIKELPFIYGLKSADNKVSFAFGIGNELKKYEKPKEIVLVSDKDIEEEKQQAKENVEKALNDDSQEEVVTTTTTKKTTEKKTETGAQRVTTSGRTTSTRVSPATSQQTTSLTTTNNEPPQVMITTTIPPED